MQKCISTGLVELRGKNAEISRSGSLLDIFFKSHVSQYPMISVKDYFKSLIIMKGLGIRPYTSHILEILQEEAL